MIWLSSTIAKCWNAARGVAAEVVLAAALGDLARRLLPDLPALVGEVERDVRRARAAGPLVVVLLGVLDVQCRSAPAGRAGRRTRRSSLVVDRCACSAWTTTVPGLTSTTFDVVGLRDLLVLDLRRRGRRATPAGPARTFLAFGVDEVVEPVVRLLAGVRLPGSWRRAARRRTASARRALEPAARAAGDRRRVGLREVRLVGGPAARAEDVRLPVVEVHLRRLADLARRPGRRC